jgi:hypothetical protein
MGTLTHRQSLGSGRIGVWHQAVSGSDPRTRIIGT